MRAGPWRRCCAVSCGLLATTSCTRSDQTHADSIPVSVGQSGRATGGVAELGPLLIVPGDSDHAAIVLYPDSVTSEQLSSPLTLLRLGGDVSPKARATLAASGAELCDDAQTAVFKSSQEGWTIGLRGDATSLPVDSIESFSAADSAQTVAEVARLASALPIDRDSRFTALPFVVIGVLRFVADRDTFLVARTVRRLPQEASPFEERTLLIAQRGHNGRLSTTHSARSEGVEDHVEHFTPLAALRASGKLFLVLEREAERGSRYEILERRADGRWTVRWSRLLRC